MFKLYDQVFNITEASEVDPVSTDIAITSVDETGVSQEYINASDTLSTKEYPPNTMVVIEEHETESKTDALLIESVEKIGDADVQNEFIKEVETVQNSFSDDLPGEYSKDNVSVSPIDDLSGYVIEDNEKEEPIFNYNALYEEKLVHDTTEQTLALNETVEETLEELTELPGIYNKNETTDKEFKIRSIAQVLEARISSIIFGESFADEENNLINNETHIDDENDLPDEIMIAMATDWEHANLTWNETMVIIYFFLLIIIFILRPKLNFLLQKLQNENLTTIGWNDTHYGTTEEYTLIYNDTNLHDIYEPSATETELSTTEISDYTKASPEEVINVTDRTEFNILYDSYATEEKHNLSSIESNFSVDDNINEESHISSKIARDAVTDFGVKNALSQEKHKIKDLLLDHTNTLNITSVCMIVLSTLTLCLLCGVCLVLIMQKLKILRHSDTVAPA